MIRKLICASLFCLAIDAVFVPSNVLAAEKFIVSQGSKTSFGGLTVNYGTAMMPVPLSPYSNANWSAALVLDIGYFVVDNFAILFNVAGYTNFTTAANSMISLGIGGMYVFENESPIYPYLQASFKANWMPPWPPAPQVWSIGVAPQIGVLVSLNEHVAMDFALQANFGFPLGQTGPAAAPFVSSAVGLVGGRILL